MWTAKTFRKIENYLAWKRKNDGRVQWEAIAVNNGYGVIYRPLVSLRLPR